ncbi:MAG: ornithine cyclodeaminase family protein, partial [Pseudoalteromonas sp.]
ITLWRTAAVSALASRYLSREDSGHLVFYGSGNLAEYMIRAHLTVRSIKRVTLIARNLQKVTALQARLQNIFEDVEFVIGQSNEATIYSADIISCATGASAPLFDGNWLREGTHVDLIGNHNCDARECDSLTISRSKVYVDSRANVLAEAGELLIPIKEGVFSEQDVCAELDQLAQENNYARVNEMDITLFKSVGTALSDLIAANHVYQSLQG